MKNLLSATAAVLLLASAPALAATDEDLVAQVAALKRQEAAKNAEIAALQKKIKALEARGPAAAPAAIYAADHPPYKAPPGAAPVWTPSWAGFYIGAGYSRNYTQSKRDPATIVSTDGTTTVTDIHSQDLKDYVNGGQALAGYMFQFNRMLLGIEGDLAFGGKTVTPAFTGLSGGTCGVDFTGSYVCAGARPFGQFETLGHLRAIGGVSITPDLMAFIAGGAAWARMSAGSHTSIAMASSPSIPVFTALDSTSALKTVVGTSIGGGIQMRVTPDLAARFEYLHDWYTGPTTTGALSTVTLGGHTNTITVPSERPRFTNDAVRGSLIYSFNAAPQPNAAYASAGGVWDRFASAPALYNNSWAGFYVGGGVTQNNYKFIQDTGRTLTIDDSTTPGTDVSERSGFSTKTGVTNGHILAGYRYQWNRFLIGLEGDLDLGASKHFDAGPKSPGMFGFNSAALTCHPQFGANVVCIGQSMFNTLAVQQRGRALLTGGFEVLPEVIAFVAGGKTYGKVGDGLLGSSADGFFYVPGSSPLIGAATVSRAFPNTNISGTTWGGGLETKAWDGFSIRAAYYRDIYKWHHLPIGGAGFGGTSGTISVSAFSAALDHHTIVNDSYQLSLIYQLWNPQR